MVSGVHDVLEDRPEEEGIETGSAPRALLRRRVRRPT